MAGLAAQLLRQHTREMLQIKRQQQRQQEAA